MGTTAETCTSKIISFGSSSCRVILLLSSLPRQCGHKGLLVNHFPNLGLNITLIQCAQNASSFQTKEPHFSFFGKTIKISDDITARLINYHDNLWILIPLNLGLGQSNSASNNFAQETERFHTVKALPNLIRPSSSFPADRDFIMVAGQKVKEHLKQKLFQDSW